MSIVDELRAEAKAAQSSKAIEQSAVSMQRQHELDRLRPTMQALFTFFRDVVNEVNTLKPKIEYTYDIPGFGTLKGLEQRDYVLKGADPKERFSLNFVGVIPDIAQVPGFKGGHAEGLTGGQFIRFRSTAALSLDHKIGVEAYVPVSVDFRADPDAGVIRVAITNLRYIGSGTYSFEPEAVTEELMEALARCALRRPNRFQELSGDRVATEFRMRLKHGVEKRRQDEDRTVPEEVGVFKKVFGIFGGS